MFTQARAIGEVVGVMVLVAIVTAGCGKSCWEPLVVHEELGAGSDVMLIEGDESKPSYEPSCRATSLSPAGLTGLLPTLPQFVPRAPGPQCGPKEHGWIAFAAHEYPPWDPTKELEGGCCGETKKTKSSPCPDCFGCINDEAVYSIWRMRYDGQELKRLSKLDDRCGPNFSCSPDGAWIAYEIWEMTHTYNGEYSWVIRKVSTDGKTDKALTWHDDRDARNPRWSPTGEWIAYESGRRLDTDLTSYKNTTPNPHSVCKGYIPDDPSANEKDIWVVSPDDGGRFCVTGHSSWGCPWGDGPDLDPAWSPDGKEIAFTGVRNGESRIYVAKLDKLMDPDQVGSYEVPNDYPCGIEPFSLYPGTDPAWSPDGKHIYYVWRSSPMLHKYMPGVPFAQLLTQPRTGGAAEVVTDLDDLGSYNASRRYVLHHDGCSVYYTNMGPKLVPHIYELDWCELRISMEYGHVKGQHGGPVEYDLPTFRELDLHIRRSVVEPSLKLYGPGVSPDY